MDLEHYIRMDSINIDNIIDHPEVHNDNQYSLDLIQAGIKYNRIDLIKNIKFGELPSNCYVQCKHIEVLMAIKPYVNYHDLNVIESIIMADNLQAIKVFEIDLSQHVDYIETVTSIDIIKTLIEQDIPFSPYRVLSTALDFNRDDIALLMLPLVDSVVWIKSLNCKCRKFIEEAVKKFGTPVVNMFYVTIAIKNGHLPYLKQSAIKKKYPPSLLDGLFTHGEYEIIDEILSLGIIDSKITSQPDITNMKAYEYYEKLEGFQPDLVLEEIILNGQYQIIKKILNKYPVNPSPIYLDSALKGSCPITTYLVLNHLITKQQLREYNPNFSVADRRCYLVYLKCCCHIGHVPPDAYDYAISFDSPTILSYSNTILSTDYIVYDAIINTAVKIFHNFYKPNIHVPESISISGLVNAAKSNNIEFVYTIIKLFGVPSHDSYQNYYGSRGIVRMVKDYQDKLNGLHEHKYVSLEGYH